MDELIAFLTARYDEAEAVAKAAGGHLDSGTSAELEADLRGFTNRGRPLAGTAIAHIAATRPDRVLRDIAAKRAILAMCEGEMSEPLNKPEPEVQELIDTRRDLLEDVLRHHATEFSDHRDYRAEWCPECEDGLVHVAGCNCGSPADASIGYAHEPLCGWEQCPNGCWERLHPQQDQPSDA